MDKKETIDLTHAHIIGNGAHRRCYVHPDNPKRCIKIIFNFSRNAKRLNQKEIAYYEQLNQRLDDWSGIPRYYGQVQTNLGPGWVYDCIVDFDGKPSKTLDKLIAVCDNEDDAHKIVSILKKCKRYLNDNDIVTLDLRPYNILCQRVSENEIMPVICDNIGTRAYIPVVYWLHSYRARQRDKRWETFMQSSVIRRFLERFQLQAV